MASILGLLSGLLRNPGTILGLLKNPFILGLAFLAWTAYQRHDAASGARATCEAAQLKADMAELARQLAARDRLLKETRERADATEVEVTALEKERDAILAELAATPPASGAVCEYPPGVRERLRQIS
jgi:hypothetical protein